MIGDGDCNVCYVITRLWRVLTGVLLSALFLANQLENDIQVTASFVKVWPVYMSLRGQIFFSSSEKFMQGFDFKEDVKEVIIDLTPFSHLGCNISRHA